MKNRIVYTLKEIEEFLKNMNLVDECNLCGCDSSKALFLTYDSREVTKGTVFICKGNAFRKEYLDGAVSSGAVMYISEKKYETEEGLPYIIVRDIRKVMGVLADFFYCSPWKDIKIVATGGTKGKSTTTCYIKAIMDDYLTAKGKGESGQISSIDIYDGINRMPSHITTPEAIELQRYIRNAVDSNLEFLEMEVSSQALKYDRVAEMRFDVGIFLNISEDHISPLEHADFNDYFESKMKMFDITDCAVVNIDCDMASDVVKNAKKRAGRTVTFSASDKKADYYIHDIIKTDKGTEFYIRWKNNDMKLILTMPGLFNIENATAAAAAACELGIPYENIYNGLARARSKGRMELFTNEDGSIAAIVDYAHNRLSFEKLFQSVKEEYKGREIRIVFGCPGGKAYTRRKDLAEVASEYAVKSYLTEDDPGPETVAEICMEIAEHMTGEFQIVEDRNRAIELAVAECVRPSVVLVVGKGREETQKRGSEYFDKMPDTEIVERCLKGEPVTTDL